MSSRRDEAHFGLKHLRDTMAEDILNTPDDEIISELAESAIDPKSNASEMLSQFEKTLIISNKEKLSAAKVAVANQQSPRSSHSSMVVDIETARSRLNAVLRDPQVAQQLTLAARKESELTDSDVLSLLEDIEELGYEPSAPKDADS